MQRDRLEESEWRAQAAVDENHSMSKKLEAAEEAVETQAQALRRMHDELAPGAAMPAQLVDLTESLQSHAAGLLAKLRNEESDSAVVKADLGQALNSAKELEAEVAQLQDRLAAEVEGALHLRENLAEERAKVAALESATAEGRAQLSQLREQLSDGETGSETLRKKLEAEESRVSKLTEELASR